MIVEEDNEELKSNKNKNNEKNPPYSVRLGRDTHNLLIQESQETGKAETELIKEAVRYYLDGGLKDLEEKNKRLEERYNKLHAELNAAFRDADKKSKLERIILPCSVCGGELNIDEKNPQWPEIKKVISKALEGTSHTQCAGKKRLQRWMDENTFGEDLSRRP